MPIYHPDNVSFFLPPQLKKRDKPLRLNSETYLFFPFFSFFFCFVVASRFLDEVQYSTFGRGLRVFLITWIAEPDAERQSIHTDEQKEGKRKEKGWKATPLKRGICFATVLRISHLPPSHPRHNAKNLEKKNDPYKNQNMKYWVGNGEKYHIIYGRILLKIRKIWVIGVIVAFFPPKK